MIDPTVVDLSRLQFAVTALYHFLFVPLTMGLSFILAIMESVYVMTGRQVYKDMTRFWGKLFAINFAMGVATGITMEFQFGTNWAYFSHYVGDVFGVPLAIEGLMAFFLEATLVGLMVFGWDRLRPVQHLGVTSLVALGSNLSALWILIANGWMQHPVGADFNYVTMRMELVSFADVFFNPVAQVKFVHTVAAGYVTGSVFVLSVSAWYLLKRRDVAFALRSFAVASGFGLAAILSVIVLGDESGYNANEVMKVKLAALEGEWETHEPPTSFTIFAIPDTENQTMHHAIKIPWVMGLIATRSIDEPVIGLKDHIADHERRIQSGLEAYGVLQKLRAEPDRSGLLEAFEKDKSDLGYALLLKRYRTDIENATAEEIKRAAKESIPQVGPMFFSFRVMVGSGLVMLFVFVLAFYYCARRSVEHRRWFLRLCVAILPLPWIAAETGWIVAEYGRQPWSIGEILPTFLGVSSVSVSQVLLSLAGFVVFYTALLVVDVYLMIKYARLGPSSLHTGRYYFEAGGGTLAGQPMQEEPGP